MAIETFYIMGVPIAARSRQAAELAYLRKYGGGKREPNKQQSSNGGDNK